MAHTHEVKRGETLLSIADHYGFADWKTIWEHADNAGLRGRRPDPQRLLPGDAVFIPDKGERWVKVSTNQKHVFELKTPATLLRVALEDRFGSPFGKRAYVLEVGDATIEGRTDERGVLEVPFRAQPEDQVVITLPEEDIQWQVEVGTLYPFGDDDVTAAQAVLQNLGFLLERDNDACTGAMDDATVEAIRAFQERYKLEQNKQLDEPTKAKLEELTYVGD